MAFESHKLIEHITTIADQGNSYSVYPLLGDLMRNPAPEAQALLARVTRLLGGSLRAHAIQRQIFRAHPKHPVAQLQYLLYLTDRKGIYQAWQWARTADVSESGDPGCRAEWHAHLGGLAATLRDWKQVAFRFDQAMALTPDAPWIWVCYAYSLIAEDRYDDAISAARRALELHGRYRSAFQVLAQLYSLTGRDDDAIALLSEGSGQMQSGEIEAQLYMLLLEQRRFDEALQALAHCQTYYPLADKSCRTGLNQQFARCLLAQQRYDEALDRCRALGDPFHSAIAGRIEAFSLSEAPRRVVLNVGFVRQHHMTCAPATLSALSRYWGQEASHLEIAEEICYDGTPSYSERAWAERNGFLVREFTADWSVSKRLIDAGLPFTLTTQSTNAGHLQALVGYDALRGTVLLRDPLQHIYTEFEAKTLFADQRASGPRGMLMLPVDEATRLDGIELPEAVHWDTYYRVMRALSTHDRSAAGEIAQAQQAQAPDHWLTVWSRRALAYYDGDHTAKVSFADELIERFGETPALLLQREQALSVIGTRRQSVEAIEAAVRLHPQNPQLLTRLAQLQKDDARQTQNVARNLHMALRVQPSESLAWRVKADALWLTDKPLALEHYRIAACLNEFAEDFSMAYSQGCYFVGRAAEGLDFLNERMQRLGDRSSSPVRSYFDALEMMSRTTEAFVVLEAALQRRPDDDALRLFCVEKYLQRNDLDKARKNWVELRGTARHADRLRVEVRLAQQEGRLDDAWATIQFACEREPLDAALRQMAAQIVAQRDGQYAAIIYLRTCCEQYRTCIGLHELLLQWMAAEPAQDKEVVLRHLLDLNPQNAFMWRELAVSLSAQQRLDDAWAALRKAQDLAPENENGCAVMASLYFAAHEIEAGQMMCREALKHSIDQIYACNQLVATCNSQASRREALEFIRDQLRQQVTQGNTMLAFQTLAKNTLSEMELEGELRALHEHRPELWQAWIALVLHLTGESRFIEARTLLLDAIDRFPMIPRLHYELARIATHERRFEDARDAIRHALQLSPAWDWALRLYVDVALAEPGQEEGALALLDSPLSRSDENPECYVLRARILWKLERRDQALDPLMQALRRWPAHQTAWDMLVQFAGKMGRNDLLSSCAAQLSELHPGNAMAWIHVADLSDDLGGALAAAERASKLEPLNQRAYIARLSALMRHRDFDVARKLVEATPWGNHTPIAIQRFGPHLSWQQGKRETAIAQMRALLEAEPNNFDLWKDLADWLGAQDDKQGYADAASELVRINPSSALAHGYAGHAQHKLARIELAMSSLRKAWDIDPNYTYAAFALVDLELEHARGNAETSLRLLRACFPGAASALRIVRHAVTSDNPSGLVEAFHDLVRVQAPDDNLFHAAASLLEKSRWKNLLREAVHDACLKDEASESTLSWWIDDEIDLADEAVFDKLQPYVDADRHNRLKIALIRCAARQKKGYCVDELVERYGAALRADPRAWGEVSYGYVTCNRNRKAVEWLNDWQRDDAPFWALDNLAVALRTLGMKTTAGDVSQASHRKQPDGPNALIWLAADAALADEREKLRQLLERARDKEINEYYNAMRKLLEAYLATIDSGRSKPLNDFFALKRYASKKHKPLRMLMRDLRRKWIAEATGWRRAVRWVALI